jgi:serine protease
MARFFVLRCFARGASLLFAIGLAISTERPIRAQYHGLPFEPLLSPERVAALVEALDRRLEYIPGEVLVKFQSGVTPGGQQRALMALRSRPSVGALTWTGDVALLRDDSQPDARILAAQLREQPEVAFAEPNYLGFSGTTPNDPGYGAQWNLSALDMPRAWDIAPGGTPDIVVAVIDNGMTTVTQTFSMPLWTGSQMQTIQVPFATNPDLTTSRFVSPRDFAFWSGPVLDMNGHATHVAGTIAQSTNNSLAEAGVAYNVSLMPVKACTGWWDVQFLMSASGISGFAPVFSGTTCTTINTIAAIRYAADNGAKVINVSLIRFPNSAALRDAISYAVSRGAFVAISMGNDFENGNATNYPAAFAADIDGAMAVAAVGRSLNKAVYSNTGAYSEIAAPGGDFRDGGAAGGVVQETLVSSDSIPLSAAPRFDRYTPVPFQGTSMAAPHVAGAAALVMSRINGVTPAGVEHILRSTARDIGAPGRDPEFGFGLVQPRAALFGLGINR